MINVTLMAIGPYMVPAVISAACALLATAAAVRRYRVLSIVCAIAGVLSRGPDPERMITPSDIPDSSIFPSISFISAILLIPCVRLALEEPSLKASIPALLCALGLFACLIPA